MLPPQILSLLEKLAPILEPAWQIIKNWWWLPLPFILWWPFSFLWLWWRTDLWLSKIKFILLEVKIPKEVLKPMRAMETVMDALWQPMYDPPDWWEKWIEGKKVLSYSFEIVSIDGEPHFFIRIPEASRDSVESIVYSQYPEAEISIVDDYSKYIPQDIPNKDWDLWAADYRLLKPDPYPIKTYSKFETEHEAKEEKRIDPLAGLLEAMAKIKPGEQLWVQITAAPVTNKEVPWITEGEKIRDELAKRGTKVKRRPMILEAADVLITGEPAGMPKEEKEAVIPPEMRLTPGERDIVAGVENKISKRGFKTNIRFIYLGKRDVFFKPNLRLVFGYFASYVTENLNGLVPWGKTLTKIHKSWFLPLNLIWNRRMYLRKRAIFRKYRKRFSPLFPRKGGTFILNTEELGSLFHFPGRGVAPAPFVSRVEAKKGEAPPGLPTE
jgi:hypothetical protein